MLNSDHNHSQFACALYWHLDCIGGTTRGNANRCEALSCLLAFWRPATFSSPFSLARRGHTHKAAPCVVDGVGCTQFKYISAVMESDTQCLREGWLANYVKSRQRGDKGGAHLILCIIHVMRADRTSPPPPLLGALVESECDAHDVNALHPSGRFAVVVVPRTRAIIINYHHRSGADRLPRREERKATWEYIRVVNMAEGWHADWFNNRSLSRIHTCSRVLRSFGQQRVIN